MRNSREFEVHLRCSNCLRPTVSIVAVPREPDAPSTIEELAESAALRRLTFSCNHCESTCGHIVAITQPADMDGVRLEPERVRYSA